jgi:hypothetical protein
MKEPKGNKAKVSWSGRVVGVQPRIRLLRSFDERYHTYQGYVLRIDGMCGGEAGKWLIAIGEAAQERHRFQAGMQACGVSVAVDDLSRRQRSTRRAL